MQCLGVYIQDLCGMVSIIKCWTMRRNLLSISKYFRLCIMFVKLSVRFEMGKIKDWNSRSWLEWEIGFRFNAQVWDLGFRVWHKESHESVMLSSWRLNTSPKNLWQIFFKTMQITSIKPTNYELTLHRILFLHSILQQLVQPQHRDWITASTRSVNIVFITS